MLNDTRLNNSTNCHIPGYTMIRSDKNTNNSTSGGTAIALPNNWDVEKVPSLTKSGDGFEAVGVIAAPPGYDPMKFLSIYNHPQHHLPQYLLTQFLDTKCNNKEIDGFIGGDLNCSHEAFSSRFTNIYGTNLLNLVNGLNLYVVDNEEPTTFHRGEPNILDLFICHPNSCHLIQECYVGETVGSDHLPLLLHLKVTPRNPRQRQQNTKKIFEAETFKQEVEQNLKDFDPACHNLQEVDKKISDLTNMLSTLVKKCTIEKQYRHTRPYLPPDILSWIKTRKSLLKQMKKATDSQEKRDFSILYNRANNIVKNLLENHDRAHKVETITRMQSVKQTSQMWTLYKKLKNQLEPNNSAKRPLESETGEKVFEPDSKAEIFASRLEGIHQTPRGPLFDQTFEEEVSHFIHENNSTFLPKETPSPEIDDNHDLLRQISAGDIQQRIQHSKKSSAPGEDGISYNILSKCPAVLFVKLAVIFNFCLSIGYFPDSWKKAKVIMLQKPNKDHTNPKNYRPISLLPVIGKIFEGLLTERLVSHLERNNMLSKYQAGYRKGRSSQEHIFRLSQQVFNGFKQKKCTIAVFLDVEAAFDAVWTEGLMYKLSKLNLPTNFLRVLCSFLKARTLSVHVEGSVSREINLKAGTPQGSCLSPILFCIYVNDIPFDDMQDCHPSQFADDTGLWSSGTDTMATANKIQSSLHKLEKWCKKWRVKLSPTKTNVILFTRCYKAHVFKPSLFLFGEQLSYVTEATFLGVKFNSSLTWEPQVRQLLAKAQPRLNLIRAMSTLNVSEDVNLLLQLYKAIVRPIFEYSSVACISAATCHQMKIQSIQNAAIRAILKLPRYISTDILHDASGLPKVHQHTITFAKMRITSMRSKSPLIEEVISEHQTVAQNTAHKSPMDLILA